MLGPNKYAMDDNSNINNMSILSSTITIHISNQKIETYIFRGRLLTFDIQNDEFDAVEIIIASFIN